MSCSSSGDWMHNHFLGFSLAHWTPLCPNCFKTQESAAHNRPDSCSNAQIINDSAPPWWEHKQLIFCRNTRTTVTHIFKSENSSWPLLPLTCTVHAIHFPLSQIPVKQPNVIADAFVWSSGHTIAMQFGCRKLRPLFTTVTRIRVAIQRNYTRAFAITAEDATLIVLPKSYLRR